MSQGPDEAAEPSVPGPTPPRRSAVASAEHQEALERVRALLHGAGVSDEEIAAAESEDVIDLLVADRMLFPAGPRYTQRQVADLTGFPLELLRRFWRALGFLDVEEDERVFTDMDIEALRLFQEILASGLSDVESSVRLARVIGSSMARIAAAQVEPRTTAPEPSDPVIEADVYARVAVPALPSMARLLEFVWRRHLQAATRRVMLLRMRGQMAGSNPVLAVGFADMVGFTLLSQHLTDEELGDVVRRFEEVSHDIVTALGGRVVKMIGDEVMFVVDGAVAAARIGVGLAEAYADDDLLSDVRVGLSVGTVVTRDGDYFGPTVNLAHRIVNIANPGTVVVSDEFWATLRSQSDEEFQASALRPRMLKDLGRVQLWRLGRAGQVPGDQELSEDQRRRMRWERLSEVRQELEELRTRGERLVASGLASISATPGDSVQVGSDTGEAHGDDLPGSQVQGSLEGSDRKAAQVDHPTGS